MSVGRGPPGRGPPTPVSVTQMRWRRGNAQQELVGFRYHVYDSSIRVQCHSGDIRSRRKLNNQSDLSNGRDVE